MKRLLGTGLMLLLAGSASARELHPTVGAARIKKDARVFYVQWKKQYFKAGPKPGQAYIHINADGQAEEGEGGTQAGASVVSEGQGYGMLLLALLGEEPTARADFDAL